MTRRSPATWLAGNDEAFAKLVASAPIVRAGRPEEVRSAVLWLWSPGGSYIIGEGLTVDGGYIVPLSGSQSMPHIIVKIAEGLSQSSK
ncbi:MULTISPECIES: SDR family oxidoreductase [unclassified Pseudomonas]|uniref:SDR family oxidoreductase n=1 Tax=unclassified Pseudomonas TaxID=196821 RepID=UPI001F22B74E|nr:SDR family oxidoreductase [Pseudomonas sp. S75]